MEAFGIRTRVGKKDAPRKPTNDPRKQRRQHGRRLYTRSPCSLSLFLAWGYTGCGWVRGPLGVLELDIVVLGPLPDYPCHIFHLGTHEHQAQTGVKFTSPTHPKTLQTHISEVPSRPHQMLNSTSQSHQLLRYGKRVLPVGCWCCGPWPARP